MGRRCKREVPNGDEVTSRKGAAMVQSRRILSEQSVLRTTTGIEWKVVSLEQVGPFWQLVPKLVILKQARVLIFSPSVIPVSGVLEHDGKLGWGLICSGRVLIISLLGWCENVGF